MNNLKFKKAQGIYLFLLNTINMTAIVMPWGVCYYKGILHPHLIKHEQVHWEQYKKHGRFLFSILYLIENLRKGYQDNKYEIEARRSER